MKNRLIASKLGDWELFSSQFITLLSCYYLPEPSSPSYKGGLFTSSGNITC